MTEPQHSEEPAEGAVDPGRDDTGRTPHPDDPPEGADVDDEDQPPR